MKKLALIATVAMAAMLLMVAAPASAQEGESISASPASLPAEAGSYDVTITGSGWAGAPDGLFVTVCSGAEGGDSANIDATNALTACPTLVVDGGKGNPGGGDSFTAEISVTVDDAAIANGQIAILAGELQAGSPWSAGVSIAVGAAAGGDDMMADTGAESGLIAIIGASVLLAGLFAVGLGRRLHKRS